MKFKTIKKDGWKITHDGENFYLTYLPDILGELGASYQVNEDIYQKVLNSDIALKQLMFEFDIASTFKKIYDIRKPPNIINRGSTATNYYSHDFILTREGEKYFIEYQLAQHGGGSRKFEITKEIYEDAHKGDKSTSDLFKKYNLYHLDVPKNDVK
jgi:hypothetical protein